MSQNNIPNNIYYLLEQDKKYLEMKNEVNMLFDILAEKIDLGVCEFKDLDEYDDKVSKMTAYENDFAYSQGKADAINIILNIIKNCEKLIEY